MLPGYSRESQSAQLQTRSGDLAALAGPGRGPGQRGSVDGAAGAELLCTWELGSPPSARPSGAVTAADEAGGAAAAMRAAGGLHHPSSPPVLQPARPPSQVPHTSECNFDSDLQRARVQARHTAAASLGSVRYDELAGQAGCSSSSSLRCPGGCSLTGSGTTAATDRGFGGGSASASEGAGGRPEGGGRTASGGSDSRHCRRTGRVSLPTAAAALWGSLVALTARVLRAAGWSSPRSEGPTGSETPGWRSTVTGGLQERGENSRQPYSGRRASDPGAFDTSWQSRTSGPSGPRGCPGPGAAGAALTAIPQAPGTAMPRCPSASMFAGPAGQRDGAGELDELAVAATSLSSCALEPAVPALPSPAADSGAASAASALGLAAGRPPRAGRRGVGSGGGPACCAFAPRQCPGCGAASGSTPAGPPPRTALARA